MRKGLNGVAASAYVWGMTTLPPRLALANRPTPIHRMDRLSGDLGVDVFVWRDDMTGSVESGNKVRKLEYLLADALQSGATRVVTAGGVQSNHTRATAFLARRLGLDVTLVIRLFPGQTTWDPEAGGNAWLSTLAGADVVPVRYDDYRAAGGYGPFLDEAASASKARGESPYVVGEGGSTPLGCLGYRSAVEEMLATWRARGLGDAGPDAIVCAVGSGGTLAGLHLGCAAFGPGPGRLWGVAICDSADFFEEKVGGLVSETAERFGVESGDDDLRILDGYVGGGYGIATRDDFRFYTEVARRDGVLLDPTYTGKAFRGMVEEIRGDRRRLGRRILFLHSGGVFSAFGREAEWRAALREDGPVS